MLDESDDSDGFSPPPILKAPKKGTSITLAASDGGTLEVEVCRLWGASDVLRDAWASTHPTPTRITFDDTRMESFKILDLFVRYMEGKTVAPPTESQMPVFRELLRFTKKWGCLSIQRHVLSDLHCSVLSERCHDTKSLFLLAAVYDHAELAKTLISRDALDLRIWEIDDFAIIPQRYKWALEQVAVEIGWNTKNNDWVKVANRFEQFLQIAQK